MNPITDLLGCRFPILQGAMAVVSNPELVAAVSKAGGFGLLATGFMGDQDMLRQQIRMVKRLTNKPFGANLIPLNPLSKTFAEIIAEQGLQAVTISAGLPHTLVSFFKERGIKVLQVVANVANALKAEEYGVDAIIAEGMESGGIQGPNGVTTMVLVPATVDAVKIPVVAAGGIGDKRGFRAAMALGAKGVQVGTRFIASHECIAHANFKKSLVEAQETGTTLLKQGDVMVRTIRTPNVEQVQNKAETNILSMADRMEKSWVEGDLEKVPPAAGQVTGLIKKIKSVQEIIEDMVE